MLNRLYSIREPTRYREVVLTSWDRTNRNSLAQLHKHPIERLADSEATFIVESTSQSA